MCPVRTLILTREAEDNDAVRVRLDLPGLTVVDYPCVATRPVPVSAADLGGRCLADFAALAFTSRRAVRGAAPLVGSPESYRGILAAVGESTAREVRSLFGRPADLIAAASTGAGLAVELRHRLRPGDAVLHPRGSRTLGGLREGLLEAGMEVTELLVYESCDPNPEPLAVGEPAVAVFASPSAVGAFFGANQGIERLIHAVAAGPTTRRSLAGRRLASLVMAEGPGPDELAACVRAIMAGEGA